LWDLQRFESSQSQDCSLSRTLGNPQAVRSKLIIATFLKRCSSGEEWWAHKWFLESGLV
jgi:hypothetical protein